MTTEQLYHIIKNHYELAGQTFEILEAANKQDFIVKRRYNELMAAKKINSKYLIAVYKEINEDGFIITAFITSKIYQLKKRKIIWIKSS